MVEGSLLKKSPFQSVHNTEYNLSNTTTDLLKFQLQEEHKNKLKELESNEFNTSNIIDESNYNLHLQNKLDEGEISIEDIPGLISSTPTTPNDESENENSYYEFHSKPNYLNLKILIENSAFENSKLGKNSILSIKSLKTVKNLIEEKNDLKNYYSSKLTISQEFISNLVDDEIDPKILFKIIKSTNSLNKKIFELNEEINELNLKLNNHNLSCLLLGYIEDIKINKNLTSNLNSNSVLNPDNIRQILDKFISYIVSISVQRNINLPSPLESTDNQIDEDSIELKFQWLKQCIDRLLETPLINVVDEEGDNTNITVPTSNNTPSRNLNDDTSILNESSVMSLSPIKSSSNFKNVSNDEKMKIINEYKTALNDLRFSHQYLVKEFEYSRENSMKVIQDQRKKISVLEKQLKNSFNQQRSENLKNYEVKDNDNDNDLKDQEISKLRKQLNNLKVDNLGSESDSNNNDEDQKYLMKNSMSNGILRKEFKKIVSDIQDQYEIELSHERILRKKLQDQLDNLNVRGS